MSEKQRALFDLFKEEKRREERAKRTLDELESITANVQRAKAHTIEKLIDIQSKEQLTKMMDQEDLAQHRRYCSAASATAVRELSEKRLRDEIAANLTTARNENPDGFIAKLDQMLQMTKEEARKDVATMVGKYLDPHLSRIATQTKSARTDDALPSTQQHHKKFVEEKQKEIKANVDHVRDRNAATDRMRRVSEASGMFKKDLGDLQPLLLVAPVEYKTSIGKREAEINDLRLQMQSQRAEEEQLLQERKIQADLIQADQAALKAAVDQLHQKLAFMRREMESKALEVREIEEVGALASGGGGGGAWAANTIQLEKDLNATIEQEAHLRKECEAAKRVQDVLAAEKDALVEEVANAIETLQRVQEEHKVVLDRVDNRMQGAKRTILQQRTEQLEMTKAINELRYRMLHRREDTRRRRKLIREEMNTVMGLLSIEDHRQSLLMAQVLELQKSCERTQAQADHHLASLQSQLTKANQELQNKADQIRTFAVDLTNYFAGGSMVKEVKLSAVQLQTQIDNTQKEVERIEKEAAEHVAAVASRIDGNMRENNLTLKYIASLSVTQEDVRPAGVDAVRATTDELQSVRDGLHSELTQRVYREGKYTQCIRMFRDRLNKRMRGETVEPLTLNRRMSQADRKARANVHLQSTKAREAAKTHLRQHTLNARSATTVELHDPATQEGRVANAAAMSAFRTLVINFIKREIQPLFDANQISKVRFVDVVHRVSTWYMENHAPSLELSEYSMQVMSRKIQETLTWQDEQRLKMKQR